MPERVGSNEGLGSGLVTNRFNIVPIGVNDKG